MLKKLVPILIVLGGLGAGVGVAVAMKEPDVSEQEVALTNPCGEPQDITAPKNEDRKAAAEEVTDFIKLPNQFVVPVVDGDRVKALVVMSLTIEISEPQEEAIFARLPKLRDGFLRVILDHANMGGFDGNFTSNGSMDTLRSGFVDVAQREFPQDIHDVLILDINRQDLS